MRYLMAKIFGWQYVAFPFAFSSAIGRIRTSPDGTRYVIHCGRIIKEGDKEFFRIL